MIFPAGSLVSVSGSRDLMLPPGSWLAWHYVTESPRGGESASAIGRLTADLDSSDPRLGRQRVEAADLPRRVGGPLCETLAEWGHVSPRNGPSFVGRLGGQGSRGPATIPQGNPAAYEAVMGAPIPSAWQEQLDAAEAARAAKGAEAAQWERLTPIMDECSGCWDEHPMGALVLITHIPRWWGLRVDSREQAEEFAALLRCPMKLKRRVNHPTYWRDVD
jgi:hypothetical protein